MNDNSLFFVEPRCTVCQLGKDKVININMWLLQKRTCKWIANQIRTIWGDEISVDAINRHNTRGHIPERMIVAQQAVEEAIAEQYQTIQLGNIAALNMIKTLWVEQLAKKVADPNNRRGVDIDDKVGLNAIKLLQSIIVTNKAIEKQSMPDELFQKMLEALQLFVPSSRQLELSQWVEENIVPILPDNKNDEVIENNLLESASLMEEEESNEKER